MGDKAFNNVYIDVVDKDTGMIKQSVSSHNKATRNMVHGIVNFLSGKFTYASAVQDDDIDARKYIPCYIGFGTGGIINDDPDNVVFDDAWNSVVDYYATDLVREIKGSRSRIRKQDNTFKSNIGRDLPNCGSADSIILYTEISPNSLNEKCLKKSVCLTEFGLFPDDSSSGNMLAHVKFSYKDENVSTGTVIKTINISNSEYSTNTSGEFVLDVEDVEHCSPILTRGSISGNVAFTYNNVEMYVPFIDDSDGNLVCTESVIDASTSTVFATSGEIIGTVDYSLAKILLDTSKPYINRSEEWVYTDAYDTHDNRSGLSWYGNRIIVPQPSLKPGVKSVIQPGENTISYQLPYGAFPGTYSMTFIAKDDGNGNLLCTTEVSYGSTVYIPVGTVIGTFNYTSGMATILPEYCTDIGPNHIDITNGTVSISYLRKYYIVTFIGYNDGNINFQYDIVADESFTRHISEAIVVEPNDVLSVTWTLTVASIGEDNVFYNSNVYDEFGNSPIENSYITDSDPLSNIIVLTDQENQSNSEEPNV